MKYKKYSYILLLILMLIVGINRTYAEEKTCYYISSDDNLKISLKIGYGFEKVATLDPQKWSRTTVWKTAKESSPRPSQEVENWFNNRRVYGVFLPYIYTEPKVANAQTNPNCPRYIVYTSCPGGILWLGTTDKTYATDSSTLASDAITAASKKCEYAKYADNYKNGKQITEDMFFATLTTDGIIEYDENKGEYTCSEEDKIELFGEKNDDGETYDPNKDEAPSIRYIINQILGYIRIIVPILIILLGTLDFAKAVLAGKEDNLKKAQSTFVKRLIAGVAVFFVPVIVDIIMDLADIVWAGEYTHCDF